jgi:hypothetical protein
MATSNTTRYGLAAMGLAGALLGSAGCNVAKACWDESATWHNFEFWQIRTCECVYGTSMDSCVRSGTWSGDQYCNGPACTTDECSANPWCGPGGGDDGGGGSGGGGGGGTGGDC